VVRIHDRGLLPQLAEYLLDSFTEQRVIIGKQYFHRVIAKPLIQNESLYAPVIVTGVGPGVSITFGI
ncbi:MAG: hypothetical protein WCA45_02175, partial [Thiobacillaceae bacterium]